MASALSSFGFRPPLPVEVTECALLPDDSLSLGWIEPILPEAISLDTSLLFATRRTIRNGAMTCS